MKKSIFIIVFLLIIIFNQTAFANLPEGGDSTLPTSGAWYIDKFEPSAYSAEFESTIINFDIVVKSTELSNDQCAEIVLVEERSGLDVDKAEQCCTTEKRSSSGETVYVGDCSRSLQEKFIETSDFKGGDVSLRIELRPTGGGGIIKSNSIVINVKSVVIETPPPSIVTLSPVTHESVIAFIDHIINIIFWLVTSFAFVMVLIGGFMMITSAGDPSRVTKGRNTVFFALAGFALVIISKGIVTLVQAIMGVKEK